MNFISCNKHKDYSIFKFGIQINVFKTLGENKKISEKNCNIVNESIKNNLKLCQIAPNLNHKLLFLVKYQMP